MPALEERVDNLEQALASYLATDERIRRESEARHAWVEAQLLALQQKGDKDRERADKIREQADKDREQADKAREQAAGKAQEEANAKFFAMQQKGDEERARMDAIFRGFNERADKERRDFNKRMAELSDSMGTLVEDMVAPNGERIAGEIFGDDPVQFEAQRLHRRKGGETMELDLLVAGSRHVMIVEAKRRIQPEDPGAFIKRLQRFKEFFPEYSSHQIVPVMASITIEPSIVSNLNKRKVYGLAFGDETFELVNLHKF